MTAVDAGVNGPSGGCDDWSARCTDAYGRSSDFGLIKKPGSVVLVAPPGGAGVFDFGELCELLSRLAMDARYMLSASPAGEGGSQ